MIITPRVYVHRRLNQAQKAVLAGNYKLAAVITHWEIARLNNSTLWRQDFTLFLRDHAAFSNWILGSAAFAVIGRLNKKLHRRRHARP